MNDPIRKTSTAALLLFIAVLVAITNIQVFQAPSLNADQRNKRTLYREFDNHRGPIIVDGEEIAYSTESDDDYGFQRIYKPGSLYAPVTGFFSVIVGRSGIERYSNSLLNGSSDSLWLNRIKQLTTGKISQGSSVELTIDAKVQQAAAKALGNQRGAAVAINVKTGAIVAMVSSPTYDPNELASHDRAAVAKKYQELLEEDGSPLTNRAIAGETYPPGSVFKLVTAAAALENDTSVDDLDGGTGFQLPQSTSVISNYGKGACASGGKIDLANALRISCNTAFADLGIRVGADNLLAQARSFGFDESLAIPLPVTSSRFPQTGDQAQTAIAAIGQGSVRVTPLQVAEISATIANGGKRMKPYLVSKVRTPDLQVQSETQPEQLGQPISSATAATLTDMMVSVVESGTGTKAQISGLKVAGKTGTAQTGDDGAPHAWFTGFAPANDPQIAVAVVVENGGSLGSEATGGAVAAPIAAAILKAGVSK
ncbi:peptidoglycan D,D-transpeptidase FtsI family protein [Rarobacter incanus]|uniref:Cell elongation-specific peptidoglycan D,D-transpeptidase n=1 Tax=Rarobacter incanus TaxID=153494 RepID=A0A542SR14_9MICO|nr:penicillin-binding protein 2 [Rarobacter incanus]TQK76647.1 cell elongation-specific peptidoglycan D,D-transpeptidase [Rarobacter incanus]